MSSLATRSTTSTHLESTDADLCRHIERALANSGQRLLHTVEVRVHEGLVILNGQLPSYYLKQLAQAITLKHQPVEMLQNDIKVVPAD